MRGFRLIALPTQAAILPFPGVLQISVAVRMYALQDAEMQRCAKLMLIRDIPRRLRLLVFLRGARQANFTQK
jgi:hypothetical protein